MCSKVRRPLARLELVQPPQGNRRWLVEVSMNGGRTRIDSLVEAVAGRDRIYGPVHELSSPRVLPPQVPLLRAPCGPSRLEAGRQNPPPSKSPPPKSPPPKSPPL